MTFEPFKKGHAVSESAEGNRSHADRAERYAREARAAFRLFRNSSTGERNRILSTLARELRNEKNRETILAENGRDVSAARNSGMASAMLDRLILNPERIEAMARAVDEIAAFPDPVGEIISGMTLANGMEMKKKRVPLGVVFTVYESRPNVTIDIGALCVKSGNAAILRGGKEALHSNLVLYRIFREALLKCDAPENIVQILDDPDRDLMTAILDRDDLIDLVVPRGGEALIRFVCSNTRIPVVKHDRGVCNLYIERSAEPRIALDVAINAKLQRPSVCNSIENLLIHQDYPFAKELLAGLRAAGADLSGCVRTRAIFPDARPIEDEDAEYAMEFLDNRLSVKIVSGFDEAIHFIYKYGSSHSEGIITMNTREADRFTRAVDSAAVFVNCSTRFHDGGQMGMGAEVGISTGRLHVRGPMGVRDLTTTTYIMTGDGQTRG